MSTHLASFVAQRRPDWEHLEQLVAKLRHERLCLADVRQLDTLYRRASSDLARAQAFFPETEVHRYLNQLCGQAYGSIYRPPPERWSRLRMFYREVFPRTAREEGPYIAASAGLFLLGVLVGALVVWVEPRGAELLVPAGIRRSVSAGHMWTDSLLSVVPPGMAASAILTNNLTVAITAFALGGTGGAGTLFILMNNGVHLGAVAALCLREQLGLSLLDFVIAHGPVELSIIVICGGAGLMVGHAMIEPSEVPRGTFIQQRAAKAVRLVVGCAPFLTLVGIVEGYVSPGPLFPTTLKVAVGLLSGAAFWIYLIYGGRRSASPADSGAEGVSRRRG